MHLRLPPPEPRVPAPAPPGPVLVFLPARDEEATVAAVLRRAPDRLRGRPVRTLVVDDGSVDGTVDAAEHAGARVVRQGALGLGAAVRRGLAEAVADGAAVVAFCDADGEYDLAQLERLVAPILDGDADYVVGSRFAGRIERMLTHRRAGNQLLTRALRFATRTQITDGQSGFRALSRRAAESAVVVHDYNYAQVLTIDLLAKGFLYAEAPISYQFREHGRSFIRPVRYLREVAPAAYRALNGASAQSSTTWARNASRAPAHAARST